MRQAGLYESDANLVHIVSFTQANQGYIDPISNNKQSERYIESKLVAIQELWPYLMSDKV